MIVTRSKLVADYDFRGALPFARHGARSLTSSGTWYDVWSGAATEKPWPVAAATCQVASTSVADTGAGTGAQVVRALVIDDAFAPVEVDVTMHSPLLRSM